MLIVTALTLAILWAAGLMLSQLIGQNGDKILAALQGRSWASEGSAAGRPATVRFSPQYMAPEPAELRAAA